MTPESRLVNEIRLYCGQHNLLCYHMNIGTFYTPQGQLIRIGPGKGFPDLLILNSSGKALFIETKVHPRRPTNEQLEWQKLLRARGFVSTTVFSLDEFILLLNNNNIL